MALRSEILWLWKPRLDKRLHALMHELSSRFAVSRGQTIGHLYTEAIKLYLKKHRIPKTRTVIERKKVWIELLPEAKELFVKLEKLSKAQHRPVREVVEDAVKDYLDRKENYLGESTYKRYRPKVIKNE